MSKQPSPKYDRLRAMREERAEKREKRAQVKGKKPRVNKEGITSTGATLKGPNADAGL